MTDIALRKLLSPTDPLHTVRLAQLDSQEAISELVARYQPLIHQLAQTMCTHSNTYDTLVEEGRCGILNALQRFDENKSKNFSLYVKRRIRKYMNEYIEKYSTAEGYPDPTQTSDTPAITKDSDSIFYCPADQLESFSVGEIPDYPDF